MRLLAHPLTRGLDLDDPRTTLLRRRIVRQKAFLRRLYGEWYARLGEHLPAPPGRVLELGAGGGFLALPGRRLWRSEVTPLPGVDLAVDARHLPYASGSLDAIVMTNVLHHVSAPLAFLAEAERTLVPGGALVMIEPWRSPWSERIYRRFHHEPFDPAAGWTLPPGGPLSAANDALPWILFARDRNAVAARVPGLDLAAVEPLMPFAYLLSGGVSLRALVPGWLYRPVRWLERRIEPRSAMFALIVLRRRG